MPNIRDETLRCSNCKYGDIRDTGETDDFGVTLLAYRCKHSDPEGPVGDMTEQKMKDFCPLDKPALMPSFDRFKAVRKACARWFT